MKEWLSEEEQYKEILNNDEISRIEDLELREIRQKHWSYRHKIFKDEHNISDKEFMKLFEVDVAKEREELEAYRKSKQE